MKATYKTPNEIAVSGFAALVDKLGPGGALRFINQSEPGAGDYTKERKNIFKKFTLAQIERRRGNVARKRSKGR